MRFLLNWLVTSIAVAVATALVPGIVPFGPVNTWLAIAFTGLFLSIVNSLVKPILSALSLPLTIVTFGIFQLVVNALMLSLAGWLSLHLLGAGIAIADFGSAFAGGIVVSIMRTILSYITRE